MWIRVHAKKLRNTIFLGRIDQNGIPTTFSLWLGSIHVDSGWIKVFLIFGLLLALRGRDLPHSLMDLRKLRDIVREIL